MNTECWKVEQHTGLGWTERPERCRTRDIAFALACDICERLGDAVRITDPGGTSFVLRITQATR